MRFIQFICIIIISVEFTDSLVRINVWHSKLKQLCASRGDTLYQELINYQESLSSHLSSYYAINEDRFSQVNACQNDNNSKLKLQSLVNAVQLCMDDVDRLKEDQTEIFTLTLLQAVCQLHVLGGGNIYDNQCLSRTETKLSSCKRLFQGSPTILLPLIYSSEECSAARNLMDCLEDAMNDCKGSTLDAFQSANNFTHDVLYGCSDIPPYYCEPMISSNSKGENLKSDYENQIENQPQIKSNSTVSQSPGIMSRLEEELEEEAFSDIYKSVTRFNFTRSQLREECSKRNGNFLKNVEKAFTEFLSVKSEKQFSIAVAVKSEKFKNKPDLGIALEEHCYNDSDIRHALENLLTVVEECLDEDKRLENHKRENFLTENVNSFCPNLDTTAILFTEDQKCIHDFATFFELALCNFNVTVEQSYFYKLPLLFISSPQECSDLNLVQSCKLNLHEKCQNSTKVWLLRQFHRERQFAGCDRRVLKFD